MSKKRRRGRCRFCRIGAGKIDYKDVDSLQKHTSSQGKILSRKRTGCCAKHQRQLKVAIKRARVLALLPFVSGF